MEHDVSCVAGGDEELGSSVPTAAESKPYMVNGGFVAPEPRSDIAAPKKGGAFYLAVKRVLDILFSLFVCMVLAIPVALICLAIAIDSPGGPFFRQSFVILPPAPGKAGNILPFPTMLSHFS